MDDTAAMSTTTTTTNLDHHRGLQNTTYPNMQALIDDMDATCAEDAAAWKACVSSTCPDGTVCREYIFILVEAV